MFCFSLFMNVSKPRPNDHPLLVLFIVGGVTCSEVHQIREAFAAYHPNTQVSFSKTCFLTFVVAWSRALMDIMGLWLLTVSSSGSSVLLFFSVFGDRRSKGREKSGAQDCDGCDERSFSSSPSSRTSKQSSSLSLWRRANSVEPPLTTLAVEFFCGSFFFVSVGCSPTLGKTVSSKRYS